MGSSDEVAIWRDQVMLWWVDVLSQKTSYQESSPEPNMAPGLFMGWRIDSGLRYRGVLKVLDYQEYRGVADGVDCIYIDPWDTKAS